MSRQRRNGQHSPRPIENTIHPDKRKNNPTEELSGFAQDEERSPMKISYPRDASLDPQLVWTGKDEQNASDLEVDLLPIYIQEHIDPKAIIADLKKNGDSEQYRNLFDDVYGNIEFTDLIDFYQHEHNWSNRIILGDSRLVMNSLAHKEMLKGKVQMIFIDPPYGITFSSNWQPSTQKKGVNDKPDDVTREPEVIKAYRDTWKLQIHSYLTYLRDRLSVARQLLNDTGSMFVQISDENVHLVRSLMDEIFGRENFVRQITFAKRGTSPGAKYLGKTSDYLIWYANNKENLKYRKIYHSEKTIDDYYTFVELPNGTTKTITKQEKSNPSLLPKDAKVFQTSDLSSQGESSEDTPFEFEGEVFRPRRPWRVSYPEGMLILKRAGRIIKSGENLKYKDYLENKPRKLLSEVWTDTTNIQAKKAVVETRPKVIQRCILMTTDPGDLVLDPTCGSGTTAYVAEQWGRRWITIDTSRVMLALTRVRLMSTKYDYYLLLDSPDGLKAEAEHTHDENVASAERLQHTSEDIKKGFVYNRIKHITSSSVVNTPGINDIYAKYQNELDTLRLKINRLADTNWEEWEIPVVASITESQQKLSSEINAWWALKRKRQAEIDAAIDRHSEYVICYDDPHIDTKRCRVTGPFTVESLSPYRALPTITDTEQQLQSNSEQFETMVIENLKKAGIQNGVKSERLKFDWIALYPGLSLSAEGEYSMDEEIKRVAICIGPEFGSVTSEIIKEAVKEARKGLGYDLLIVCGYAFEPSVATDLEQYRQYLRVEKVRIHTDLWMADDDLLKKTDTANLFMIFGEPDIDISKEPDGQIVVELKGVDVYAPTKDAMRPDSTDKILCWFIDTNYNGELFIVRHAYFSGTKNSTGRPPYEALAKTLKTEITEEAWNSLYRTESRPFPRPDTGKIAVKIINEYGDEVMKVYKV